MNDSAAVTLWPKPDQLRRINREFIAFVRAGYPRRFWDPEVGRRDAIIAAALLRMTDTLESLMLLMAARKDLDAAILLRSMFEQMVRLCWVLIDPAERMNNWHGYTSIERLKQHRQLAQWGIALFADEDDLLDAEEARQRKLTMPTIETMAREVDRHWTERVRGLHPDEHVLSLHGLYQIVYRSHSASVHGSLDALDSFVVPDSDPPMIRLSNRDRMIDYVLGAPILGITLVIAAEVVEWIDVERARRFVNRASGETIRRRERSAAPG